MIVNGTFSLNCSRCNEQHDFAAEDAYFEFTSSDERSMGTEKCYTWETTIECECGNEIEIEYEVWEYPIGGYNSDDVNITGGTEISRFSYDFSEEPELEDFQDEQDVI